MLDYLTSAQLSEWEALNRIDPIGKWREDYQTAKICSLITNLAIQIHAPKNTKLTTPLSFMPDWDGTREEDAVEKQTPEEMLNIFKSFIAARKAAKMKTRTSPPKAFMKRKVQ